MRININEEIKYSKYYLHQFKPDINKKIEIWKDIEGYEGRYKVSRYKVSNHGNVLSLYHNKYFEQNKGTKYYRVKLYDINKNTKMYFRSIS